MLRPGPRAKRQAQWVVQRQAQAGIRSTRPDGAPGARRVPAARPGRGDREARPVAVQASVAKPSREADPAPWQECSLQRGSMVKAETTRLRAAVVPVAWSVNRPVIVR